jgi:hypothetical protein
VYTTFFLKPGDRVVWADAAVEHSYRVHGKGPFEIKSVDTLFVYVDTDSTRNAAFYPYRFKLAPAEPWPVTGEVPPVFPDVNWQPAFRPVYSAQAVEARLAHLDANYAAMTKPRKRFKGWVNCYDSQGLSFSNLYSTKKVANDAAHLSRIACIPIYLTEGEGLDG